MYMVLLQYALIYSKIYCYMTQSQWCKSQAAGEMGPDSNLYDLPESSAKPVKYKYFPGPIQKEWVLGNNSTMHLYA